MTLIRFVSKGNIEIFLGKPIHFHIGKPCGEEGHSRPYSVEEHISEHALEVTD